MSVHTFNEITFSSRKYFDMFIEKYVKQKTGTCWDWYNIGDAGTDENHLRIVVDTCHYDSIEEEDVRKLSIDMHCALRYYWSTHDGFNCSSDITYWNGVEISRVESNSSWIGWEFECMLEESIKHGEVIEDPDELMGFLFNERYNGARSAEEFPDDCVDIKYSEEDYTKPIEPDENSPW